MMRTVYSLQFTVYSWATVLYSLKPNILNLEASSVGVSK